MFELTQLREYFFLKTSTRSSFSTKCQSPVDRFGNLWVQGESRTKGQAHEWDVQLSRQGIQQVGWMTRDNTHLNVSLDGRVTHK